MPDNQNAPNANDFPYIEAMCVMCFERGMLRLKKTRRDKETMEYRLQFWFGFTWITVCSAEGQYPENL